MATDVLLRPAIEADAARIATIWQSGWHDGHVGHVPDELVAARTTASFTTRAASMIHDTAVAEINGLVVGFVTVVDDEVEQVYLAGDHRGAGIADMLLDEAERRVCANGHRSAWLAVVSGNARARAFYKRRGWRDDGPFSYEAAAEPMPVAVMCQRYRKLVN